MQRFGWVVALGVGFVLGSGCARWSSVAGPTPVEPPSAQAPRGSAEMPARGRSGAPFNVGLRRIDVVGGLRPVVGDLWYPIAPTIAEQPQRYVLTQGDAAPNAPLAPDLTGPLPLVVLSHGAGGSATDYHWLTETLAAHGFLVLGVHHFGESRVYGASTVDPRAPLRFWLRPRDVQLALDAVWKLAGFGERIDASRLYGVAHSAGAHTLLAVGGVPFEIERLATYCSDPETDDHGCDYATQHSLEPPSDADGAPPRPREDVGQGGVAPDRSSAPIAWTALALMEPALGPSFAPDDLRAFTAPVQLFATRPGDFLPFEPHAGYFARWLPEVELVLFEAGEGHFAFLGECDLAIEIMGVALCRDAPGVERSAVHAAVVDAVLPFFEKG